MIDNDVVRTDGGKFLLDLSTSSSMSRQQHSITRTRDGDNVGVPLDRSSFLKRYTSNGILGSDGKYEYLPLPFPACKTEDTWIFYGLRQFKRKKVHSVDVALHTARDNRTLFSVKYLLNERDVRRHTSLQRNKSRTNVKKSKEHFRQVGVDAREPRL